MLCSLELHISHPRVVGCSEHLLAHGRIELCGYGAAAAGYRRRLGADLG
jgi:hypothetical protein